MKKIISIFTVSILVVGLLAGCGANSKRELYAKVNLADYVEVGDYLGLQIDTATEEYQKNYAHCMYNNMLDNEVTESELLNNITFDESAEVSVELCDMVNIDYVGYKDGKEIENGSNEGDLIIIGSGGFVDDFEDQLIGARVGDTVNVSVTFPSNYSTKELAGAKAEFVVKINSIAKTPEQIYKVFNIESEQEYIEYLNKITCNQIIQNTVCQNSKIKDYPEKEINKIYQSAVEFFAAQNIDITGQDKDEVLKKIVYPMMDVNMVMYYILDTEELEIYESTVESQDVSNAVIAESYAVQDIVLEYLLENAVIK